MILEYRCKNFMSFEDEIEFSTTPDRLTDRYKDNVYTYADYKHSFKSAVIFGENTGGKTNFIKSLETLKNFILRKIDPKLYKNLTFLKNSELQTFFLKCLINNKIYTYELELSESGIEHEVLYVVNPKQSKPYLLYTHLEGVKLDNKLIEKNLEFTNYKYFENIKNNENLLYFIFENSEFKHWIKDKLILEFNDIETSWISKIEESEKLLYIMKTTEFLELFKIIDSSISNIRIDENLPFEYTKIFRENFNSNKFIIDIKNDSMGVRDFFKIAINLYKVIYEDCVVISDEVDRVLNAIISNKIIKIIHGSEHKGQFIYTTHNVMNLNTRDFIKSQIYFISKKDGELASELYSLADFDDIRNETKDLYKYYLKGMFGGTPNV